MNFYFHGITRLQLCFASPNLCAAFLNPLTLLLIGLLYSHRIGKTIRKVFCCFVFIMLLLIFFTFSRGAWLGCLTGMVLPAALLRKRHPASWLWPIVFSSFIIFSNLGLSRITESNFTQDDSITNRFKVWSGGCALIAENWTVGVGLPPTVGEYYERHYQRHLSRGGYSTLLNDFLTLAASLGLPITWLIATSFFCVFFACACSYSDNSTPLHAYAIGAICSFIICGMFSTLFIYWQIMMPTIIAMAVLVVSSKKEMFFRMKKSIVPVSLFTCVACLCVFFIGKIIAKNLQFYIEERNNIIWYKPSLLPVKNNIIILAKDNEQIAQKWLIYLAEEGYAATAVVLRDDVYLQMKNIISSLPKDIKPNTSFLAVDALSSAYVFSLRKNGYNYPAFVINPPLEWPLEELSPKHILQYYHIGDEPLIFFCDELSKEACNAAEELCCECSKQHLKCNVHMFHPSLIQGQILNFLETFYSQ